MDAFGLCCRIHAREPRSSEDYRRSKAAENSPAEPRQRPAGVAAVRAACGPLLRLNLRIFALSKMQEKASWPGVRSPGPGTTAVGRCWRWGDRDRKLRSKYGHRAAPKRAARPSRAWPGTSIATSAPRIEPRTMALRPHRTPSEARSSAWTNSLSPSGSPLKVQPTSARPLRGERREARRR